MFKDNRTRLITRASINSRSQMRSKKDRKDWDDRFSIERMPEYNTLIDRHWQAYVNMIKKKFKKTKCIQPQVEMAPGRIRRRKIKQPNEGSVERNGSRPTRSRPPKAGIGKNRNAITDEVMETLKEDLNRIWDEFRIPQYHNWRLLSLSVTPLNWVCSSNDLPLRLQHMRLTVKRDTIYRKNCRATKMRFS